MSSLRRALLLAISLASTARADEAEDPDRLEPAVLPALGYDSDTGFGFGAIASLVRFRPGYAPYRWRLQAQLYMTIKSAPGGGVELPFHDDYLILDAPRLFSDRLRPSLRVAFGRFLTTGYYGIGNGAEIDRAAIDANPRVYQYDWIHPEIEPGARIALAHAGRSQLDLAVGAVLAYEILDPYPGSKLEQDLGEPLVVGVEDHALASGSVGLLWDTRDHETTPTRGMFHELTLRGGAGIGSSFGYGGARATARGFAPLAGEHLVLAARAMADALFGRPPLYELPIGGALTLRGVRGQRLHGKVKLLGNLELRGKFFPFRLRGQRLYPGALLFLDAGRVFADYRDTGLDGEGAGIALGTGGGLRVQWGEHFLVRADVGYSPTDDTTGVYVDVNHIF